MFHLRAINLFLNVLESNECKKMKKSWLPCLLTQTHTDTFVMSFDTHIKDQHSFIDVMLTSKTDGITYIHSILCETRGKFRGNFDRQLSSVCILPSQYFTNRVWQLFLLRLY